MKPWLKKAFKVLRIVGTFGLLAYVFHKYINLSELAQLIPQVRLEFFLLTILINLVMRFLRSYQLLVSLKPFQFNFQFWDVLRIQELTAFYTLFLPGTIAGGGVNVFMLSKDNGHRAQALSVVAYLFLLGWLSLVPFALLGILFEPRLSDFNIDVAIYVILALSFLLMLPFMSVRLITWLQQSLTKPLSLLPEPIRLSIGRVMDSIKTCASMPTKSLLNILGVALLMQLVQVVGLWSSAMAVGIELPWTVYFWMRGVLSLIAVAPLLLSGTGLRELSFVYLLTSFYGCSPAASLLFSMFQLLKIVILSSLSGLFFTFIQNKKLKTAN